VNPPPYFFFLPSVAGIAGVLASEGRGVALQPQTQDRWSVGLTFFPNASPEVFPSPPLIPGGKERSSLLFSPPASGRLTSSPLSSGCYGGSVIANCLILRRCFFSPFLFSYGQTLSRLASRLLSFLLFLLSIRRRAPAIPSALGRFRKCGNPFLPSSPPFFLATVSHHRFLLSFNGGKHPPSLFFFPPLWLYQRPPTFGG